MRLRFLCQSALWIEHGTTSVLVDPWLEGSCYEGGWELLPEVPGLLDSLARPDWIIYTHEHPDHFHVPTLRRLATRFGRDLRIAVPQLANERLARGIASLGFTNLVELAHGKPVTVGEDLSLTVWSVRADDSVQLFRGGGRTILNANDCRIEGRLLSRIAAAARQPDVYLGQYSLADGYPYTFSDVEEEEARKAARRPLERFIAQSAALAARAKVPIASFVRFAASDNAAVNRWITTVDDVKAAMPEDEALAILFPGDGWDDATGFWRDPDHETRYRELLADVREGRAPLSPREPVPERGPVEEAAARRFADMFRKIPRPLRARIGRLGFHLNDAGRSLVVDWRARTLTWSDGEPEGVPYFALGAGYFLKVCNSPWGWSNLHIGCRFRVHGWKHSRAVEAFLPASILYGMGYFDRGLRGFLGMRALGAFWKRRVEIADLATRMIKRRLWARGAFRRI